MDELSKLADKYGADKWGKHHYTPVYYDLMRDKKDEVKFVFEIGTAEGASLFMWRDFFKNAIICGGEIEQARVDLFNRERSIYVYKMDQSNMEDIHELLPLFKNSDLIIDDGSHKGVDQMFTFLSIAPFMKKGAVYVIEDVADTDIIAYLSDRYYIEVKEVGQRYDDRLIIFKKP